MGRGRAKAKQQKVARDLKYNTHFTDLDALQRELGVDDPPEAGGSVGSVGSDSDDDADDYGADDYGDWANTGGR